MRVDVEDVADCVGFGLRAGADGYGAAGLAAHAVGIGEDELRFVGGVRLQIKNANGEHVGCYHVDLEA